MAQATYYPDAIDRGGPGSAILFPEQTQKFLLRQPPPKLTASTNHRDAVEGGQIRMTHDVLVRLPSLNYSKWKVKVLQRWIGRVERVDAHRFRATLNDATNSQNPSEEVDLELSEVSESDLSLVAEGATFYWSIGYRDTPGGQRERVAALRFARQPRFGTAELNRIFEQANRTAALLEND